MKPEAITKDFLKCHHHFPNGFTLARLLISLSILFFNLAPTDNFLPLPVPDGKGRKPQPPQLFLGPLTADAFDIWRTYI